MKNLIVPLTLIAGIVLAAGVTLERLGTASAITGPIPTPAGANPNATSIIPKGIRTIALVKDDPPQPTPFSVLDGIWAYAQAPPSPWALRETGITSASKPSNICGGHRHKVVYNSGRSWRCRRN